MRKWWNIFSLVPPKKLISLLIVILYHSQKTDNTCRCLLWNLMVNFFHWVFLQASFNFLLLCNLGSSWLIDECLLFLSNYILILHNVKIIWRVSIISLLICPHNYDRSTFHQILGSWGALFNGFQISLVWNSLPPTTFLFTKLVISSLIPSLISSKFLFVISITEKENGIWCHANEFWWELSTIPRTAASCEFHKVVWDVFK